MSAVAAAQIGERAKLPYCTSCSRHFYYPRPRCPFCWGAALEERPPNVPFRIRSYTWVIRPGGVEFEHRVPILLITAAAEGVNVIAEGVGWPSEAPLTPGEAVELRYGRTPEGRDVVLFTALGASPQHDQAP